MTPLAPPGYVCFRPGLSTVTSHCEWFPSDDALLLNISYVFLIAINYKWSDCEIPRTLLSPRSPSRGRAQRGGTPNGVGCVRQRETKTHSSEQSVLQNDVSNVVQDFQRLALANQVFLPAFMTFRLMMRGRLMCDCALRLDRSWECSCF